MKHLFLHAFLIAWGSALLGQAAPPSITTSPFGQLPDGRAVTLYSLVNQSGMRADITNYGAVIVRLFTPDRAGRIEDVVLGYDSLDAYLKVTSYFGAVVGRYGNRIAGGRFTLDGETYQLATNSKSGGVPTHLHGGKTGFNKVLWAATPSLEAGTPTLRLRYLSKEGEEGYPGNLEVTVVYRLGDDNSLKIEYQATTDRPTPVNLTQHSYFNLQGEGRGDILGHVLTLHASHVLPVDAKLIPTGELAPVAGTPFDFTTPHPIGARIDADHEQIRFGRGYDHNWVLDDRSGRLALAAEVFEPVSGRTMEVWTEEPGLQFYSGNAMSGKNIGKSGRSYPRYGGFCLETQHYPDSPNQPAFPNTILRPGETYRTTTVYTFSAR